MKQFPRSIALLLLVVLAAATAMNLSAQQRGAGAGRGTGGGGGRGQGPIPPQGRGTRGAPPGQPTFRAETNVVLVDLRVVDGDGQFVRDLTREDFRVFEDDAPQAITSFELVDIPIEPPREVPASPIVSPDVASNEDAAEGRLYVIVLDDVVGQVNSLRAPTVRALAREFIEQHMTDTDRAAVMSTAGRSDIAAEFTNDRRRLLAAVDKFEGNFGQVMPESPGSCRNFRMTSRSLESLASWLSQINGRRKAIVYITERMGSDVPGLNFSLETISTLECENVELARVIDAASGGNVALYIIDPVGVSSGPASGVQPVFVDDDALFNPSRRSSLVAVAEATGGFALVNSNQFTRAFRRVVEDNSSYYLLGYTSTDPDRDGDFRRIRVEVSRPGLTVRARSGYVASERQLAARFYRGTLPPTLTNALQSPVSLPGLVMSVSAMPLRGNGSRAIVPVLVGVEDGAPRPDGVTPQRPLDLVVAAADKNGSVKDMRRLKVDSQRLLVRLELTPGRYHVRVAAVDASGQMDGSVLYDFDVPDFTKGPLNMSALVLASSADSRRQITGFTEEWQKLLRVPPTTTRAFAAGDELQSAFEIYDFENRSAHRIDITTTVTRDDGSVAHRTTAVEDRAAGGARPVTFARLVTVPLSEFAPGSYTLTVEAQSTGRDTPRVMRQVPFRVH